MYVYTTTTKIVFLVVIEHFSLFCRLSFLYDFKGVFDMVEKKTDRRILKTKRALRESLLYLLKEQPIKKISFPAYVRNRILTAVHFIRIIPVRWIFWSRLKMRF